MIADPYQEDNVCGAAVNEAARIMDAANPGQLLVNEVFFLTDESIHWLETSERNAAAQIEDKKKAIRELLY